MKLSELLKYDKICIQMHDNPDPDALASAYALYLYFTGKGKSARIVYGGRGPIQKSNLRLMMAEIGIDATYYKKPGEHVEGLLLTVDCQYGESNVTHFEAKNIAIIDHHQAAVKVSGASDDMTEIHSYLGSCSTLVWKMLKDEGIDISENKGLNTALYYGLMTDTGNFVEIHHPLDRDMMDDLKYDKTMIYHFCNSNISLDELRIAGDALVDYKYNEKHKFTVVASQPCDPNILGLISDLALQVDVVDTCLVYNELGDGYKFSVRSCVKDAHADDLAEYIAEGIGGGGGHIDKAGGFVAKAKLEDKYGMKAAEYFNMRLLSYFEDILLVHANDYHIDTSDMKKYYKKPLIIGYVDPLKFLDAGENVVIRTLEGDFELTMDGSFYVMIGIMGEVYSIEKEKFARTYEIVDEKYEIKTDYLPTIRRQRDGKTIDIAKYAGSCRAKGITSVLAKPLKTQMKIYPVWSEDNYMLGHVGDFVACKEDDTQDIYIIEKEIFGKTYEPEKE